MRPTTRKFGFARKCRVRGTIRRVSLGVVLLCAPVSLVLALEPPPEKPDSAGSPASDDIQLTIPNLFIGLLNGQSSSPETDLAVIGKNWHPGMVPMVIESMTFSQSQTLRSALLNVLEENTGQSFGMDTDAWYRWLWARDELRHPGYASFKSSLYAYFDPKFSSYFNEAHDTLIRLDEIRWGGVVQDGIPPLRDPEMIKGRDADYLQDDNVVFGVQINGDARAYPKRILAWHEMFVDDIGGIEYAGVYCTLCGALILYETKYQGISHELGTSGFLYRSNKLMYDKATQTLWNTTWGKPVAGPLVGKDIQLTRSFVVTSTWGEWRRRHPDTTVLSMNTGHQRDYSEGAAYKEYFATDELMFTVPVTDNRLNNKDEILALQFPDVTEDRLAISAAFLERNRLYQDKLGAQHFVVLTDSSGANRVYETRGTKFVDYDGDSLLTDDQDRQWILSEAKLQLEDEDVVLERLPAHRAFWFGWVASWQDTRLIM